MKAFDIIKITKLGRVDKPFDEDSDFGESSEFHLGVYLFEPVVGERFLAPGVTTKKGERGINTSMVTNIIDENTFETLNSIYKIEKYDL